MHFAALYEFHPFTGIWHWFYVLCLVLALVRWIIHRVKTRAGQVWPVVNGTVESSQILEIEHARYIEVVYSYSVAGEYYSGRSLTNLIRKKRGEALLEQYPTGSRLLVHYKPDSPDVSVLDLHEARAKSQLALSPHLQR